MSRKRSNQKLILSLAIVVPLAGFFLFKVLVFEKEVLIGDVLRQNGFTELRPPSTLVPPGTWMTVLSTNPFQLSIICGPETSLGLAGSNHLHSSASISTELMSSLSSQFDLGLDFLAQAKSDTRFAQIRNVSFQLKNIRLLEISDDSVLRGVQNRTPDCRDAIRFRVSGGEPVSMVKSVLIADVDYRVEFRRQLDTGTEADLKKQLALELDLRLASTQSGSNNLVGRNLIWGIREDARLAKAGLGLAATGGSGDEGAILGDKGAVQKISLGEQKRRIFPPEAVAVSHQVHPLRQSSGMSCWATVYTMLKSWRENADLSVKAVVAGLGSPWDDYYLRETGLPGGMEREFVETTGLQSRPPANYTLPAYLEMLQLHGPLWIITGDGISAHARLLVGIYGNWKAEGIGAYQETLFEFIDPATGTYQYESALDFSRKFESEARWLVDGRFDELELRDQILFWP